MHHALLPAVDVSIPSPGASTRARALPHFPLAELCSVSSPGVWLIIGKRRSGKTSTALACLRHRLCKQWAKASAAVFVFDGTMMMGGGDQGTYEQALAYSPSASVSTGLPMDSLHTALDHHRTKVGDQRTWFQAGYSGQRGLSMIEQCVTAAVCGPRAVAVLVQHYLTRAPELTVVYDECLPSAGTQRARPGYEPCWTTALARSPGTMHIVATSLYRRRYLDGLPWLRPNVRFVAIAANRNRQSLDQAFDDFLADVPGLTSLDALTDLLAAVMTLEPSTPAFLVADRQTKQLFVWQPHPPVFG